MEQQNRTQKDTTKWSGRKKRAIAAVAAAALALVVLPVFAWLYMQRSMETITKVNMPYALLIGAGDAKPIQQLQLSYIDVSASKSKDVVSVYTVKSHPKAMICSWRIPQISGLLMKSIQPHWQTQMHPQTWLSVWAKSIRRVLHFPAAI